MASGGNTWQKKLMNKQRLFVLKTKGVKARHAVDGQKSEEQRQVPLCTMFGRQTRRFGSSVSPLRGT